MMALRQTGWIGVDVGTHAVKLAQVRRRRGGGLQLAEALVIRRQDPWPGDDQSPPLPSSAEIGAGLSLGRAFRGRQAAAVLSMACCDARGCHLPEAPPAEQRALVAQELETVYPDAWQTREFDFWPLGLPAEGQAAENAIAFSMPRAWSQQVAEDLGSARLVGEVLDALPLALARAIEIGAPGESRVPVAAVDWGCQRATLCIVLAGRPRFVRCLRDSGFARVTVAMCQALSVNADEAQYLLSDHGLPGPASDAGDELPRVIEEVTAGPCDMFLAELQRTIAFLRQQRRALAPSKLWLFGAGATVRNVAEYCSQKIGLPAVVWDFPCSERQPDGGHRWPSPLLASAIALSSLVWWKP